MQIFITGGTGTLGHALVERFHTKHKVTVFSRDPLKQKKMKALYPDVRFVLGDIMDIDGLHRAMIGHDIVIHAAAQKHIPEGEANAMATMQVNVDGSINVASAAIQADIKRVVGISTDKVCYPVNTYGASKMLMERALLEYNQMGLTEFALVRYGNVIGSNGSVVQVWRNQIANGRLPTLTDPEMTRFWLYEDDAVELVRLAMSETPAGSILIPMAPACSMAEFAAQAGIEDWEVIGLRPGEKMHEVLLTNEEAEFSIPTFGGDYILLTPGQQQGRLRGSYVSSEPETRFKLAGDLL